MAGEVVIVPIDRRALLAGFGGVVAMPTGRAETPKRVAPEAVDYFRSQLAGHYQADMLLGPLPLIGTVAAQCQVIDGLAGIANGRLRRDLLGLGVAYTTLAGWLYQDAGDFAQSAYWHAEALELAHRTRDLQLVGYALVRKAMLRTDQRDGQGVIELAEAALADSGKLCPKVRMLAMQQAANGYSLVNDRGECDRLLDGAAELLDRVDDEYPWGNPNRRTPGLYPEVQRATCYGRMRLAAEAARLWEQLLPQLPSTRRRDYGVYRARQATALAGSQEPEQAVKVAAEVVPIAQETGSARMRGELLSLRDRMAAWRQEKVWGELDEILASITPSNLGTPPTEGGA
ncbi:MAG: Twin-arginine translocation pathway signal [Egibacteraceae bacterium]